MVAVILKRGIIRKGSKKVLGEGGKKIVVLFFIIYSLNEPKYAIKSAFTVKS